MRISAMHAPQGETVGLSFPFLILGAGDYHDLEDYRGMLDLLFGGVRMKELDYGHGSEGHVGLFYRGELSDPDNAAFLAETDPSVP